MTAAAIVGSVLLVGGAAISAFSVEPRTAATQEIDNLGSVLSLFSLVFAIAALVTLTIALRWSTTFRINGLGNLPAVGMAVVLALEILISRAWDGIDDIAQCLHDNPPTAVTLAVASWALVVTGTVLVLCIAFSPPYRWTIPLRSRIIYVAIGILICCLATAFALDLGSGQPI
ncbi:hypothetical protein [Nocardia sp. NPDC050413]|uniref:hypothetical protein n=1 Tax=Nocardia sp. NPDC050413 TaxID=3155784 RepID=UPI00340459AB